MTEQIEIPIGKKKISLLLFGSLLFVAGGIWMALEPEKFVQNIFRINNPDTIRIWGIAGIVFFGLTGIYGIIKLSDKKAGLIIDSDGITDNTNATSIGLIEWTDITGIRTEQIMSTKFLLIDIENPEKYLKKAKNELRTKLMKANLNSYGTLISITSNTLEYNFEEMEKLIRSEFNKNKNAR
ncbi:STM3941 family protein [Maribacter polysaccharolyticus]|uniref:STM3941 family protein n=1 Tax=Maribacter polysaccharolyticus TaxID=3020831 RepID=UPI00237F78F3|nr:STM3941 family protein [Maribacter polysaccharolyticus]MDE3744149.1 hypothetical protein [Maribacter polysaccharolyticus]